MKHAKLMFLSVLLLVLPYTSVWSDDYSDAKNLFQSAGDCAGFFDDSYGYALFPKIGKGGIGIGGAYGEGRVYKHGNHVGNSSMSQVTLGLQLGGQVYSQIIFFKDKRAFDEFTAGNFEFGAQATAVAIDASASAAATTTGDSTATSGGKGEAKTTGKYNKGLATFTVAKGGLMYEATLGGQKFSYTEL